MKTIILQPTTFQYLCNEYTIYPEIVREQISDDVASGSGTVILQFSNKRDTASNINKMRKYLENNF